MLLLVVNVSEKGIKICLFESYFNDKGSISAAFDSS